jgi:hypothetical protein
MTPTSKETLLPYRSQPKATWILNAVTAFTTKRLYLIKSILMESQHGK